MLQVQSRNICEKLIGKAIKSSLKTTEILPEFDIYQDTVAPK